MGHLFSSAAPTRTSTPRHFSTEKKMETKRSANDSADNQSLSAVKRVKKSTIPSRPVITAVTARPPLDTQRTTRSNMNSGSNNSRYQGYTNKKPTVNPLVHKKKKPIVISAHQQSTKRSNYIDDLLPPQLPPPSRTQTNSVSNKKSIMPRQQRQKNRANYSDIILKARVYESLSIHRSHIGQGEHLGSSCDPVIETILLERNSGSVEKWEKLNEPPVYFERVEADANICGDAYSHFSFRRQAAKLGLFESVQNVISRFDTLKDQCDNCIKRTYQKLTAPPDHWWPVGIKGSVHRHGTCMDPELLRTNSGKIMDVQYMARQVFKLSEAAVLNIMSKKTSLLYEVSTVCSQWHEERSKRLPMPSHVPEAYTRFTTLIGPKERFLEVKVGVYYMLERGTVIKFMSSPKDFSDFVLETAIGYSIQDNITGAIGVIRTCPEAFCVEMKFAGVSLQHVINGDINCTLNHPRVSSTNDAKQPVGKQELIQHHMYPVKSRGGLYDVRMLQVTRRLPKSLQNSYKNPISDSYTAVTVTNFMRDKLLNELPFVTAEIVNIVTRLSQQGLVNPDIKSDNIVIDGLTGQPKMIDFGLIIPVGKRETGREIGMYSNYPQTAPEYLMGEKCQEAAMTYGLSYMINDMLNTLVMRTGDMGAVNMSVNIPLRLFMAKAYAEDFRKRPRAYLMAPLIGACFPFKPSIAKLFNEPKHTLVKYENKTNVKHYLFILLIILFFYYLPLLRQSH